MTKTSGSSPETIIIVVVDVAVVGGGVIFS